MGRDMLESERTRIVKVIPQPEGDVLIMDRKCRKPARQFISPRQRKLFNGMAPAHFEARHDGAIWLLGERVADQEW